ncbi:MAG: A/G-specific adenine glycosylase [Anaerolineales bacterium]|nr:A/G-specific adenine glycosylase [Anaerolineales bacterium]
MEPPVEKLLAWYEKHARSLPWRNVSDPYAIWISEVMLQQTRVEAVIPYFERWMKRFPTVADLAAAPEQDVLALWEGLGYYRRARNLHQAARIIMAKYGGQIPRELSALRRLPGVGRYTAAAIASIAYGLDVATLDGNLKRVLARLFNIEEPVDTPAGEKRLWALAEQHLPRGRAGDYNQALMDLGATLCLPRAPRCPLCPVNEFCQARALGVQESRPVRQPKKETPHYTVTAAVIRRNGRVLLAQRPSRGLLGGLWEFPGGKVEPGESLPEALRREIREELAVDIQVGAPLGVYRHAYTHFRITLHAFLCSLDVGEPRPLEAPALAWVDLASLEDYPMGKVDRLIARQLMRNRE